MTIDVISGPVLTEPTRIITTLPARGVLPNTGESPTTFLNNLARRIIRNNNVERAFQEIPQAYVPVYRDASPTERYDLLVSRSDMDWGEAPNYNEAYRKLRWPGGTEFSAEYLETANPRPNGRFSKPEWKSTLQRDINQKRNGAWTRELMRLRLRCDIINCMRLNIPFKTKTLEYKPCDQWIYVNGNPTMRYDLRTGYISEFTFSGVYNKVTSLMLRLFNIKVKLVRKKVCWVGVVTTFSVPTVVETPLDMNTIYSHIRFGLQEGFTLIDSQLSIERRRLRTMRIVSDPLEII